MDTVSIRDLILNSALNEEPVTILGWDKDASGNPVNLMIRELPGDVGSDLLNKVTDPKTQAVNQDAFIAGIILATLRNADDPNKALVFSSDPVNRPDEYDPAYRDSLMSKGLGKIMQVALKSIELSGLGQAALQNAKNGSSGTVVEGSLTVSQTN